MAMAIRSIVDARTNNSMTNGAARASTTNRPYATPMQRMSNQLIWTVSMRTYLFRPQERIPVAELPLDGKKVCQRVRGKVPEDFPTARTMLPNDGWLCLWVWCKAADLRAV